MIKTTIATSVVMAAPWWFFPGLDVMEACFSCWVVGQLLSGVPTGAAVAWLLLWLDGQSSQVGTTLAGTLAQLRLA